MQKDESEDDSDEEEEDDEEDLTPTLSGPRLLVHAQFSLLQQLAVSDCCVLLIE